MQRQKGSGKIRLSPRERDVAWLIAAAATSKEIAAQLEMAEGTVQGYLSRLFGCLHLNTRGELLVWIIQHPEALKGDWTDAKMHPENCPCGGPYCAPRFNSRGRVHTTETTETLGVDRSRNPDFPVS
jgi:DNA-binding CsgD family transcriptional regulator